METDIRLAPDSEDEVELLERLTDVREYGIEDTDLAKTELSAIFSHFAAGLATEVEVDADTAGEFDCPECGQPATDATAKGMGMPPTVEPCGCVAEWGDLPADIYIEDE